MKMSPVAALCGASVMVATLWLGASGASGSIVTLAGETTFSGDTPAGSPDFVTLTFDDGNSPGSVTLTVDTPGLVDDEFVGRIYLNLNPAFSAGDLTFSNFNVLSGALEAPTIGLAGENNIAGSGLYDLELLFNTTNTNGGAFRFNAGESFSIDIGGIGSLSADDFNFFSEGHAGNGHQLVAVHVLGIGVNAEGSGWVGTVPEPTLALTGAMLGGLALLRRRSTI